MTHLVEEGLPQERAMTLEALQNAVMSTAVYPRGNREEAAAYCLLGLQEEVGEVAGCVKRGIRDSWAPAYVKDRAVRELGDAAWYVIAGIYECGQSLDSALSDNAGTPVTTLSDVQRIVDDYPGSLLSDHPLRGLRYAVSALALSCGDVARAMSPVERGTSSYNMATGLLVEALLKAFWRIMAAAAECGYTVVELFDMLLAKLQDRQQRGALHGKGDDR